MRRALWIAGVSAAVACGGAGPNDIVDGRDVPGSSGKPSVSRVVDLGDLGALPQRGAMPAPDSDGVFVVGELVLIRGDDFGKQPTINIGGRPSEAIGRTGSGAIVARIPPGVPTGTISVEVSHPGGRGSKEIEVRRYGYVVEPGTSAVHIVTLAAGGKLDSAGALDVPGARSVAVAHDGQAAYVAANDSGAGKLGLLVATSSGGPSAARLLDLEQSRADLVVTAADAPVGAVIGGGAITMLDLEDPRNPALYPAFDLGAAGAGIVAAAISPDGETVVLLHAEQNAVLPVDVSRPAALRPGEPVAVLPEERVPLVRDLGFSPDGSQLWVVSGDNRESVVAGAHPTRISVLGTAAGLSVKRTVEISGAPPPLAVAIARRESIIGGTAIRSTARKAAIAIAGVDRGVFEAEEGTSREELLARTDLGEIHRTDLEGIAEAIWSDQILLADVALSHDVRHVVSAVTAVRPEPGMVRLDFGVAITPLAGGATTYVRLGDATKRDILAGGSIALSP